MNSISKGPSLERKAQSPQMFNLIAKTYDPLNRFLSMGIDVMWRKKMAKILGRQKLVVDLATGTGDVAITLIKGGNVEKVLGLDLSEGMLEIGLKKITEQKLNDKIELKIGDGVEIPLPDNYANAVTISFGIRNFPDANKSLENIYRVLKADGTLCILEFSLPTNALVRIMYLTYFRSILPFIGNLFSSHKNAYTYLNETVENFPYGKEFVTMIESKKFTEVKAIPLTFGIATLYIAKKR
jgi:demethylmenaquinone methyltransferase/2-methoxy-6-polyprenyl-1,4-benzoquinol methylase